PGEGAAAATARRPGRHRVRAPVLTASTCGHTAVLAAGRPRFFRNCSDQPSGRSLDTPPNSSSPSQAARCTSPPLPVSLGFAGLPACMLRLAPLQTLVHSGGPFTTSFGDWVDIPDNPSLAGIVLFCQGALLDATGLMGVTQA